MPRKYAAGRYAMGECARSGRVMPLRDMVADGYYPNLMVDPAWRDAKHPLEDIKDVHDPVALARPAPRQEAIAAHVVFPLFDVATGATGADLFELGRASTPLYQAKLFAALFERQPAWGYDGAGEVVAPGYVPGGQALRADIDAGELVIAASRWAGVALAPAWVLVYEAASRAPVLRVNLGAVFEARNGDFTIDWASARYVPDASGQAIARVVV